MKEVDVLAIILSHAGSCSITPDLMFALIEVGVAESWRMDKLLSSRCWAQDTEEEEP